MMLHTKYQGSRPCGFRQEDFFMFSLFRSFLSIQYVHGDLCKHLGIDSSTRCLHKSPCACLILKNGLILYSFRHMACSSI